MRSPPRGRRRPARARRARARGRGAGGARARRHGARAPADVADHEQVEAAAEAVEGRLGPIDVWVNDAMATVFAPFADIEPDEFRRATEVTYLGTVHGTMAALRRMVPRDRGTIVQVGSALSYRAIPLQSAYCGAKFAIRGFTDSMRTELMHDGSKVWITMVQLPGREHAAVQLVPHEAAGAPEAGAADLPARDAGRGGLLGGAPPPARARGRLQRAARRSSATSSRPASPTGTWPGPGSTPSRSKGMPVERERPDNLFEPVPSGRPRPTGIFDRQASRRARSSGPRPTAPRSPGRGGTARRRGPAPLRR